MVRSLKSVMMILAVVGMSGAGCATKQLIARTKIPDTKQNRTLLKFIDAYRKAMVSRDAAKVLTMAHPSYQDNAGTPDPKDDVDYAMLPKVLKERLGRVGRVRYSIQFQQVSYRGQTAQVDVWIDGTFVYNQPGHTPLYKRISDYHRYRLIREDGRWFFVGGL